MEGSDKYNRQIDNPFIQRQLIQYSQGKHEIYEQLIAEYDAYISRFNKKPKDLYLVIFECYNKRFTRPLTSLDKQFIFTLMHFFHFPFRPEATSVKHLFEILDANHPPIELGDLFDHCDYYLEWEEFIQA
jgi:hypothetical protein